MKEKCFYLGDETGRLASNGSKIHHCQIFDRCLTGPPTRRLAGCNDCRRFLSPSNPEFADKWEDPLRVINRKQEVTTALRDVLAGRSAFLVCGGPSANDLPLEMFSDRGCFTLAVNNMAGHARFRPNAFVCSDPPLKFSHSIWLDPGIMKFVPSVKFHGYRANLRRKVGRRFEPLKEKVTDCPNVWGFKRRDWFLPDTSFFSEDSASWGNQDSGVTRTGLQKCACTPLLGLRILRYLGARRIFLVGWDFSMSPSHAYAFDQKRDAAAANSNNDHFVTINSWLCTMEQEGVFKHFGLEIYNCYRHSGLRAFPYVDFATALSDVVGEVERSPNLSGWYDKTDEEVD